MKRASLFLVYMLNCAIALAQTDTIPTFILRIVGKDTIIVDVPPMKMKPGERFVFLEQMPQPKIGEYLDSFFMRHLQYPGSARKNKTQGTVVLQYYVKTDGTIDSLKILRSVSPEIDEEAVRLVRLVPGWKPAVKDGKETGAWMTNRIPFSIKK
ncbi:MAG: energy transducer TonB [Sphingobacteriales bacterium]|nr:MAG: energy transducer TonB [Sphingobacteriales bacterium]